MKTSTSIIKITPALLKAQMEIGSASKDAVNPFFKSKYADLGSVMEACKESLNKNGILVLQPVGTSESDTTLETVLLHESGEWISDTMKVSIKQTNDPQAQGSAITYARRYSLQSMMFIPAEDDDAEKATDHNSPEPIKNISNITCPICGGSMWDNTKNKLNPKSPDYKCKDKNCKGVIWPPKDNFPHYDAEGNGLTEEQYKKYTEGIDIEDIEL